MMKTQVTFLHSCALSGFFPNLRFLPRLRFLHRLRFLPRLCVGALLKILVLLGFFSLTNPCRAGFLEMPSVQELPEAQNDILLKDLDIPPVRDRSPHPESGPRLNVTSFRVQGIVEFPELGITRQSLIELVENMRYDMMKEGELMYDGYTLEELNELQNLLSEIEKETRDEHVGPVDVQRLIFLIREQRRQRGVTLGMLEDVTDQITDYYRQRGFVLAKAFIPEQQVRDGVVTITLLLGNLGEVRLENNRRYSQQTVEKIFRDDLGQPVNSRVIEEKLFYVNDLPGLNVQGFFAPGDQVGDTRLSMVVKEEPYRVNVRTDNHGSDVTGEYRVYSDLLLNNPLKFGDRLHLAVLGAFDPESATYGMVRYSGPLWHYRWKFDTGISQNAFISGLGSNLNIGGKSTTLDLGARFQINRSRVKTTAASITASRIQTSQEYRSGGIRSTFDDDQIHNIELAYQFDLLRSEKRTVHMGGVRLIHSRMDDSLFNDYLEDGWMLDVDYTTLRFVNIPLIKPDARLVLRANAFYSGRQLASVNQFALAGPTRSRGYRINTFFADDGLHLGFDLLFEGWALREYLQPYLLADAAHGVSYLMDPNGDDDERTHATLVNAGLGCKISLKNFRANFSLAYPLETSITDNPELEAEAEPKWYFDLQYSF
jgi:hemolysin activation/secretion protein